MPLDLKESPVAVKESSDRRGEPADPPEWAIDNPAALDYKRPRCHRTRRL
jgi:hypothetical protein